LYYDYFYTFGMMVQFVCQNQLQLCEIYFTYFLLGFMDRLQDFLEGTLQWNFFFNLIIHNLCRLWRPFLHSKTTFLKKVVTKKKCKVNLISISKNPFEILILQSKVIGKVQRGVEKDIFLVIFKHLLWILSITFDWRLQIANNFGR